jgi:hypothetical protein
MQVKMELRSVLTLTPDDPQWASASSFTRFPYHTQRRTIVAPCSALSFLASSTGLSAEQNHILCESSPLHITTFDHLTIHFNIIIKIFNVEIIFFSMRCVVCLYKCFGWCCYLILRGRKALLSLYDKISRRHFLQIVTWLSPPWDDQLNTGNLQWATWIRIAFSRSRSCQLCRSMETLVCINTTRCINPLKPSGHFTYCRV